MKYILTIIIIVSCILISCNNKNNDEENIKSPAADQSLKEQGISDYFNARKQKINNQNDKRKIASSSARRNNDKKTNKEIIVTNQLLSVNNSTNLNSIIEENYEEKIVTNRCDTAVSITNNIDNSYAKDTLVFSYEPQIFEETLNSERNIKRYKNINDFLNEKETDNEDALPPSEGTRTSSCTVGCTSSCTVSCTGSCTARCTGRCTDRCTVHCTTSCSDNCSYEDNETESKVVRPGNWDDSEQKDEKKPPINTKDIIDVINKYSEAAENGDAESQTVVGIGYYYLEDYEKAIEWLEKSANQGFVDAKYILGVCYAEGKIVKQDYNKALALFREGANQNMPEAKYALGICFANGYGVRKNDNAAVKLFIQVADQGLAEAQHTVGVFYYLGRGIAKNDKKALEYFKKAANQGLAIAEFKIGLAYLLGYAGTEINRDKARDYFTKAANKDLDIAKKYLREYF